MRSPSATSRNHPSLQTRVSVKSGPSHPHDDPGTQTRRRSVTRCSGDYVATNRWLTKGCSREEQGAAISPTSKGWKGTNVLKLTIAHPPQRSHDQVMKPVNRQRPAPDGGPKVKQLSKVVKGFSKALKGFRTVADRACDSPLVLQGKQRKRRHLLLPATTLQWPHTTKVNQRNHTSTRRTKPTNTTTRDA
jgi:hypothetical protein